MILTVDELRRYIETDDTDQVLEAKLKSFEHLIRVYTNNNFQVRAFRAVAVAMAQDNTLLANKPIPFKVGDTLQITESEYMPNELVTVRSISGETITVNEELYDESGVVITKVVYPEDIKTGVANLILWDKENRAKAGIESETISRHTINYINLDAWNSAMGFPASLVQFLKPYKKAQFGKGIGV